MEINQDMKINRYVEINQEKEVNQYKEAQKHTKNIVKAPVEQNIYIVKYIYYTPTYFIKSC